MPTTAQWLLRSTLIPLVLSWSFKSDEPSQPALGDVTVSSIKDACRVDSYKTHLISEDPLVIYIESFVTPEEASQLTDLSFAAPLPLPVNPDLTPSQRRQVRTFTPLVGRWQSLLQSQLPLLPNCLLGPTRPGPLPRIPSALIPLLPVPQRLTDQTSRRPALRPRKPIPGPLRLVHGLPYPRRQHRQHLLRLHPSQLHRRWHKLPASESLGGREMVRLGGL
jgi:hypothetical protein